MKPLLRDMVRVGGSVAVVTTLVLLPGYLLRTNLDRSTRAKAEPAADALSIVSLDEGWNSVGIAINDSGDVVGTAFDETGSVRAFVRRDKTELLPLPKGAPMSVVTGINESGVVVGSAGTNEKVRGILWQGEKIGILTAGKKDTIATTVSKEGVAAGIAINPNRSQWSLLEKLRIRSLRPERANGNSFLLEFGTWGQASSANFSGMVWKRTGDGKAIGEFMPQTGNAQGLLGGITLKKDQPVPAFFKDGKIVTLPQPEGARLTVPMSINKDEVAVGASLLAADRAMKTRPIGWSGGRTSFLPVPGDRQGVAFGINDQKVVVGAIEAEDGMSHAAVWKDGKVTDIHDLIEKESGWTLIQARDINNNGQIVGTALKGERLATFVIGCRKDDNSQ